MTTPIDGSQGAPISVDRTDRTERPDQGRAADRSRVPSSPTDRVDVSSEATLASSAVQAAHETPAIRADRVEAARKALADGTLGADAARLADVLIDHMLDGRK